MNYPKVSIVIPTYNRCEALKLCFESIMLQTYPKELLELLVLDDASTDSTEKEIPESLHQMEERGIRKVSFFHNEQNVQVSACRRILGEKASPDSEYILFLDDDAYVIDPNCLKILVEYMINNEDVGVVGPRIVFAKNPDKTAHTANFVGKWTGRYAEKYSKEMIECDWVISICCLVKKTVVEKTGGFYPGYYTAHEEVDFCLRAKKYGFKVVYNPLTSAQHDEVLSQIKRERLYYLYRNKILLIRRNFGFIRKIVALSLILLFGLPKYLIESIKFHKKIVISEMNTIFLSIFDGLSGVTGRRVS